MATKALIIPAAGIGSRMQKDIPKPFLQLGDCTIIEQTIQRFSSLDGLKQVIVPTSKSYLGATKEILQKALPADVEGIVLVGGNTRQESIHKALKEAGDVHLIIVHDAVRPFVRQEHICNCCEAADLNGGAVLGVPAKDTIKKIDGNRIIRETPSRKYLWQTQTPQVFQKELLMEAYQKASEDDFLGTDDSSLVERLGYTVVMVEGDRSNFKITYPLDLELAQLLVEKGRGS
ncbi:2-C-methyl-D-erythritol 4-phosphate cytidylyltransferase [Fodinibius sp. Rm-B-1B1-1]|uniref:2-C-methyl-D-erythritol 4-phosphate cytidylyltransferase n=1 Tax=Fodinibius alkaliphilus TaxID=3140241 RepID=UPI00315AA0C9